MPTVRIGPGPYRPGARSRPGTWSRPWRHTPLNASVSSPAIRCVDTVRPLAAALHVKVEEEESLAEGMGLAGLALVRSVANEKIALCTHGDVIPEILVALADEDHLDLGPRPRQAKASVWVLEAPGGRFVKAAYLPPVG